MGPRPALKRARSGDAARHITGECERLFCGVLRAAFLVERDAGSVGSLVMDVHEEEEEEEGGRGNGVGKGGAVRIPAKGMSRHELPTPSPSPDGRVVYGGAASAAAGAGVVRECVEMWDYSGGARFRGFVAERSGEHGGVERGLFVFFDADAMGKDLKLGFVTPPPFMAVTSANLE